MAIADLRQRPPFPEKNRISGMVAQSDIPWVIQMLNVAGMGEASSILTKSRYAGQCVFVLTEVGSSWMLQRLFGGSSPAETQFLIASTRLSSRFTDGELAFTPGIGRISFLGFAKSYGSEPFGCAPSTKPSGYSFYSDKFLNVQPSDKEIAFGGAELSEAYVYDEQYRSDIDLTGLRLVLTLQQPAFDSYEQFVRNARVPASTVDPHAWHGDLLIVIPSPVFKFPNGRGSDPPYPPAQTLGTKVGKLHKIQNFRFDTIDIVKIGKQVSSREPCVPDIFKIPSENVLRLRNGHRTK